MRKHRMSLLCAVMAAALLMAAAVPALAEGESAAGAPVAENLELNTYRNVSVGGRLSAVDPEGDTVTFEISTEPGKGTVELTKDGRFVYTPDKDRRGRDYFGYRAVDSEGNASQEATVIIRISKQKTQTFYSDMAGDRAAYAATLLAEEGIFTGEKLGSQWVFYPQRGVTRGEFLSMCLELCGTRLLSGVASTGFTDDGEIPLWQKPYVATALMDGVISGYSGDSGAAFEPNEPISRVEAAVMLDSALDLTDAEAASANAPQWAAQAVANTSACGILDGARYSEELTRSEAAEMLAAAIAVREARDWRYSPGITRGSFSLMAFSAACQRGFALELNPAPGAGPGLSAPTGLKHGVERLPPRVHQHPVG